LRFCKSLIEKDITFFRFLENFYLHIYGKPLSEMLIFWNFRVPIVKNCPKILFFYCPFNGKARFPRKWFSYIFWACDILLDFERINFSYKKYIWIFKIGRKLQKLLKTAHNFEIASRNLHNIPQVISFAEQCSYLYTRILPVYEVV
jgi:hypothetical protein